MMLLNKNVIDVIRLMEIIHSRAHSKPRADDERQKQTWTKRTEVEPRS